MKTEIHPKYDKTIVTCGCGNTFETKSTTGDINVEICSACHPFYTGKQKLVDTAGRVDRFKMKMEASAAKQAGKTDKKKTPKVAADTANPVTLSDIKAELKDELVENSAATETAEAPQDKTEA